MTRDDALRKIRACLSRAKHSTFPEEAARAMAQAQALMARFDVDNPELLASSVAEQWAKGRAAKRPPEYEVQLANIVARMFSCKLIFSSQYQRGTLVGGYTFIAPGSAAEVAAYTYSVLSAQLVRARAEYTKTHLARYRKNKVAAADEFCAGWVQAVGRNVHFPAIDVDRQAAVNAFVALRHPELGALTTTRRELANSAQSERHATNGWLQGSKAQVHAGIGKQADQLRIA